MDVSASLGVSASSSQYESLPTPARSAAVHATPEEPVSSHKAEPLPPAINDAPAAPPSTIVNDIAHLPPALRYAPSPAPHDATVPSLFDDLA